MRWQAHASGVNALHLGPASATVLATAGDDKRVNLWDTTTHNALLSLTGHTSAVESVQFDNKERTVVAGSAGGTLKLWDLNLGRVARTLTGHRSNALRVTWHPFSDFFASGSADTNLKIWDIRRRSCIQTYRGHKSAIRHILFSPDGRWVVSGADDGLVKLWDLTAGKLLHEFPQHTGTVAALAVHPTEFLMATAGADRTVSLWDLETFEWAATTTPELAQVRQVRFGDDGSTLITATDESLRTWTWEPIRCHEHAEVRWSRLADMAVDANQQLVGASVRDSVVSLWRVDLTALRPFSEMPQEMLTAARASSDAAGDGLCAASVADAQMGRCGAATADEPAGEAAAAAAAVPAVATTAHRDWIAPLHRLGAEGSAGFAIAGAPSHRVGAEASAACAAAACAAFPAGGASGRLADEQGGADEVSEEEWMEGDANGVANGEGPCCSSSADAPPSEEALAAGAAARLQIASCRERVVALRAAKAKVTSVCAPPPAEVASMATLPPPSVPMSPPRPRLEGMASASAGAAQPPPPTLPPTVSDEPRKVLATAKSKSIGTSMGDSMRQPIPTQEPPPPPTDDYAWATQLPPARYPTTRTASIAASAAAKPHLDTAVVTPPTAEQPPLQASAERPRSRNTPIGLDAASFMPQRGSAAPESNSAILRRLVEGSAVQVSCLATRLSSLRALHAFWASGQSKQLLMQMERIGDPSVTVDVLRSGALRTCGLDLEGALLLMPQLRRMLLSEHDEHAEAALEGATMVLDSFGAVISASRVAAHAPVGVDLSAEARARRCEECCAHFRDMRTDLHKLMGGSGGLKQRHAEELLRLIEATLPGMPAAA